MNSVNSLGRYYSPVLMIYLPLLLLGCATNLSQTAELVSQGESLVTGRIVTVITGERTRIYLPELRMFELLKQDTGERFSVEFESGLRTFALSLAPGNYHVTRIQISEGPFLSMAEIDLEFSVEPDVVTDLGIWRFGVDSPRYGRMVALSIVDHDTLRDLEEESTSLRYPEQERQPTKTVIPRPAESQARLYEVMPYPRYSKYFRRHVW